MKIASDLRIREESSLFYSLIIFEQGFSLLLIVQSGLKFCFPPPRLGLIGSLRWEYKQIIMKVSMVPQNY